VIQRAAIAGLLLAATLLAALPAAAQECQVKLGRGWPPATANYGGAVEQLFNGPAPPVLSLLWLPSSGKETGLALIQGAEGAPWTLRYSEADERVYRWSGNALVLQTEQTPEQESVPIPAALGQLLLKVWGDALRQSVPSTVAASFHEGSVLSAVVDGVRFSGPLPDCGPAERILRQAELLIEASGEKESKRERRWSQLDTSLQELQRSLAGQGG
jgi:hypothetical protein